MREHLTLNELQAWMQSVILRRPGTDAPQVADIVCSSERLTADRHIEIYMRSYVARLLECMRNQFRALSFALGDLFDDFAAQYLAEYPSGSYTLNDLGARFPAYLQQTRPDADSAEKESWPDFMIELATFEYALSVIFDQEADENADYASEATPDSLLRPAPVLHLFRHTFPVCTYYLEVSRRNEPELPFPQESCCAVVRRDYKLGLFELRPAQYYFLSCLQQAGNVKTAIADFADQHGFAEQAVYDIWPEWKRFFLASGFLVEGAE